MPLAGDRVKETTTTTGTGTITLAGAASQHQTFSSAFSVGSIVYYAIADQSGTNWEIGYGTLLTSSTLSRDTVISSSNSNALVSFTSGTKDVYCPDTKHQSNRTSIGHLIVKARGWCLP